MSQSPTVGAVDLTPEQLIDAEGPVERRLGRLPLAPAVVVAGIGVLLMLLVDTELFAVVPLLGALEHEYGMTATQGAWSLSATSIATASSIAVLSRLADMFGMRRLLMISLTMVIVGTLVCALAPGPVAFITGRALAGVSAAPPIYFALLRLRSDTSGAVNRYSGALTAGIGAGIAVSFLLGGVVIHLGGNPRTVFWIATGLAALVLLLVWGFVSDPRLRVRVGVDVVGAVLVALALGATVIGIGQGNKWGWTAPATIGVLVAAIALLVVWVFWELQVPHPMIDLRVMRQLAIWPAFVAAALVGALGSSTSLTISNWIQTPPRAGYGLGGSVLTAGLYLCLGGVTTVLGGAAAGPIIDRFGVRKTAATGAVLAVVAFSWFAGHHDQRWQIVVMVMVYGLAYALTFSSGVTAYLRAARPGETGMVSGAARTLAAAVSSLGPAAVTAITTASFVGHSHVPAPENYKHVYLLFAGVSVVLFVITLLLRENRLSQAPTPDAQLIDASGRPITG